jgi:hypothetical protein
VLTSEIVHRAVRRRSERGAANHRSSGSRRFVSLAAKQREPSHHPNLLHESESRVVSQTEERRRQRASEFAERRAQLEISAASIEEIVPLAVEGSRKPGQNASLDNIDFGNSGRSAAARHARGKAC